MLVPKPMILDKENKLHAAHHAVGNVVSKNNFQLEEQNKPHDPE